MMCHYYIYTHIYLYVYIYVCILLYPIEFHNTLFTQNCVYICAHMCMEARRQQWGLLPVTVTFCFSLASGSPSKWGWVTSESLKAAVLSLSPQHWDHSVEHHLFPWVLWLQLKQDFIGARIFPAPCDFFFFLKKYRSKILAALATRPSLPVRIQELFYAIKNYVTIVQPSHWDKLCSFTYQSFGNKKQGENFFSLNNHMLKKSKYPL